MLKLIAVTLAALVYVLHVFGDESRRVEVARQVTDESVGTTFAALQNVVEQDSGISDAEAIRIAMASSTRSRENRTPKFMNGVIAAVEAEEPVPVEAAEVIETKPETMWYVTGTRVNLRAGPGTGNAVVGQLGLGSEALILTDKDGWYQIKTADGAISGWIYGSFLDENRPG